MPKKTRISALIDTKIYNQIEQKKGRNFTEKLTNILLQTQTKKPLFESAKYYDTKAKKGLNEFFENIIKAETIRATEKKRQELDEEITKIEKYAELKQLFKSHIEKRLQNPKEDREKIRIDWNNFVNKPEFKNIESSLKLFDFIEKDIANETKEKEIINEQQEETEQEVDEKVEEEEMDD